MEKHNIDKIGALINYWGVASQLTIAMEEAAELQVVCSKLLRGQVDRKVVVDALGDSYVMLQTLCIIFGIMPEELDKAATEKLELAMSKTFPPEGQQQDAPAEPAAEEKSAEEKTPEGEGKGE